MIPNLLIIIASFMPTPTIEAEPFTFERDGYACLCVPIVEPDESNPAPESEPGDEPGPAPEGG